MDGTSQASAGPQVFISYAHQDYEQIERLYHRLLETGYRPWIDKEGILPGELWENAIKRAIQDSDFFLAVLSKNSVNRKGVLQSELKQAMDILDGLTDTDIFLIPVKLDDCDPPRDLSRFQWVDLSADGGWAVLDRGMREGLARRGPHGIKSLPRHQRPASGPVVKSLPVLVPLFSFASKTVDHYVIQTVRGEVSQTNSIVTVDRPGWEWDVLFYYLIYYSVAAAIVWLVFRYALKRPSYRRHAAWSSLRNVYTGCKIVTSAAAIVLMGFLISLFVLEPKVDPITDISGTTNDPGRSYYLIVRPVGSARCWLQSPVPLLPGQDGKWNATAFFGGISGQRFEIIAIASKTPLHVPAPNPPSPLAPFNKPDSYDCNVIPSEVERYVRVVVIK